MGSLIYRAIETKALELQLSRLFSEASITAKPFFLHLGFSVVKRQLVACRSETFVNYTVEKLLSQDKSVSEIELF